jgi:hypothetical protein
MLAGMERVVILGRGGAGKSTAAMRLGPVTRLPVIELDKQFWRPDLSATPPQQWRQVQQDLAAASRWIMDWDLESRDAPGAQLGRADTVQVLDFSLARCAWRATRRSRERADFWWWLLTWRQRDRPAVLQAIATYAPTANLRILHTPRDLRRFLSIAVSRTR